MPLNFLKRPKFKVVEFFPLFVARKIPRNFSRIKKFRQLFSRKKYPAAFSAEIFVVLTDLYSAPDSTPLLLCQLRLPLRLKFYHKQTSISINILNTEIVISYVNNSTAILRSSCFAKREKCHFINLPSS